MIIRDGWPRKVKSGPAWHLLYRLDAEAGDTLRLPEGTSSVECTEKVEIGGGKATFAVSAKDCYCTITGG
jgi:hypothetical protein